MEYITQLFYIMVAYICLHLLETGMAKRKDNKRMLGVLPPKTWNDLIIIGLVIYGAYLVACLQVSIKNADEALYISLYIIISTVVLIVTAIIAGDRVDYKGIENLIPFANKPLLFTQSKEEKIATLKAQIEKAEGSK